MDEKTMVNDILNDVKMLLNNYQKVITETENIQLRQAIQQIRNNNESFQYEILKLAESKGYSIPEEKATLEEVTKVRNEFAQ